MVKMYIKILKDHTKKKMLSQRKNIREYRALEKSFDVLTSTYNIKQLYIK